MGRDKHVIDEKGYIPENILKKYELKKKSKGQTSAAKDIPKEVIAIQVVSENIPDEVGLEAEDYFFAGWQLEYGISSFKDTELAVKAYEIAVSKGYIKAIAALGDLFRKNEDFEAAYRWYLEGSLLESPLEYSLFGLALMYHEGEYVACNYEKAMNYFRLAHVEGCMKAAYYLGQYYEYGYGTKRDYQKACDYYRIGAEKYDDHCRSALNRLKKRLSEVV